jgi:hypothetical protein
MQRVQLFNQLMTATGKFEASATLDPMPKRYGATPDLLYLVSDFTGQGNASTNALMAVIPKGR